MYLVYFVITEYFTAQHCYTNFQMDTSVILWNCIEADNTNCNALLKYCTTYHICTSYELVLPCANNVLHNLFPLIVKIGKLKCLKVMNWFNFTTFCYLVVGGRLCMSDSKWLLTDLFEQIYLHGSQYFVTGCLPGWLVGWLTIWVQH